MFSHLAESAPGNISHSLFLSEAVLGAVSGTRADRSAQEKRLRLIRAEVQNKTNHGLLEVIHIS